MAIQFNCPSCGAMIRVPDTAASKKGTCPRCGEKLLVPDLPTATGAEGLPPLVPTAPANPGTIGLPALDFSVGPSASANPSTAGELPGLGLPPLGQIPVSDAPAVDAGPSLGLPPLTVGATTSVGLKLKQKVRSKNKQVQGAWIVPVVCVLGLVGFLAWYMWNSSPKLEGELIAHSYPDLEVKPGVIPGAASGLPAADRDEVLRHLRAEPAHWTSSASKFTLTGTSEGVEVRIRPGTASHFVGVQPLKNPAFLEYVTRHAGELDKPRLASITKHAPSLFAAWQDQFARHEAIANQKEYRDLVALPTLMTGVGYHLEAIVNGNLYPCVYEDPDGQVFFLLPNAAKSFQLQGRRVGGSHLPANFHVKIGGPAAAPAVSKEKTSKSKEDREQENEGMNPDLYKEQLEELREERRNKKGGKSQKDALKAGLGNLLTGDKSDEPVFKSKRLPKKSEMMMEGEDDLMNDEMPAKSKPPKGAMKKMMPGEEMQESEAELPAKPKVKRTTQE